MDYMSPGEEGGKGPEENKGPQGAAELGAAVGAALTEGSTLGALAGHAIGKKVGEVLEKLGDEDVVTFHEMPPEPPVVDLGKEAAKAIGTSSKKAIERAKGVIGRVMSRVKKRKN